ncbi:flagellar hook-length control protein FliK [Tepidibacter hydrothermalis]|uniref:Flagellar hook-length control protein FliK n=1 Tax=Tepidibacter hydrothermalis TaxID=3036126 RepID=A0ABY8EFE9_9FIRM|nr:flagellar hook-length control protein FliK [Tepidibacter hydrothermalis]WFD11679.1 flagellar hook-length control protein FliK [Tepidibacter hydrothermalis]
MNNLMPINLNVKKDYIQRSNKKDNISDKSDFRKKLDDHSKKNDSKDKDIKINKKNENRDTSKKIDKHNKEEVNAQSKHINKQDEKEFEENTNINQFKVVNIDKEIDKDTEVDETIKKEDLEGIMSILQSLNIEVNNKTEMENIQKNINQLIEKIDNGQINIEDFEKILMKLEDADFIPKEVKSEILNKLELMFEQKNINSKYIETDNTNVKKDTIVDENTKKDHSKIEEDMTKQENSQSKISNLNQINKDLNQNTSYNQNEDLDNINKNFLIKDRQDETEDGFNFQNLNIGKITSGIKASTGSSLNNKMSNIDSYNIIEQITKKSKLITNKNNSSIQMQLEPEHLGKLTLKVVLERGILSAKFMAENEEVKTVIEDNMEELKNSLSEQGITIQSLSVSVNSEGDLNKHKNILEAMAYNKKISKNIDTNESLLDEQQDEIENPYLFEDDNFNGLV